MLELELDFADEDLEFVERNKIADKLIESINYCKELANSYTSAEILRSGYLVGIAGYPNSGKSTLFNALLRRPRAIVSHIPGTTRDYIEESLFLNGITVKLIDTAGIRDTQDFIEIEGIKFVESILKQSNMILILNDLSVSRTASDDLYKNISSNYPDAKVILVHNKIDLIDFSSIISKQNSASSLSNLDSGTIPCVYISAKESIGIQQLEEIIEAEASSSTERINDVLINRRHSQLLNEAASELGNALDSLKAGWENELVSIDIRQAIKRIGELTGETWNEEILNSIFSRFCIGK